MVRRGKSGRSTTSSAASAASSTGAEEIGGSTEHVYFYHSSDPDQKAASGDRPAVILLHSRASGQVVEYMSRGAGITAAHGEWELTQENQRLVIWFNCREGTSVDRASRGSGGERRVGCRLHSTVLRRVFEHPLSQAAPQDAAWEGIDDKGWEIWLVHQRSLVMCGRPMRPNLTDAL
jgi:hypothetical protein